MHGRTQTSEFFAALFEPTDIIEIRRLPGGRSTWHTAGEAAALADNLAAENAAGQHIYVGANPRRGKGGRDAASVLLARNLFADFDGMEPDAVDERIIETGLPMPTLLVASGHGAHAWWRLAEPVHDMPEWSAMQRDLAAFLGADPVVHDPPRIMRVPGFVNHKPPVAECRIVAAEGSRHEWETLRAMIPRSATTRDATTRDAARGSIAPDMIIPEKRRNATLASLAGSMRRRGMSQAAIEEALLAENAARCSPPLDRAEVVRIAASIARYAPAKPAAAATSATSTATSTTTTTTPEWTPGQRDAATGRLILSEKQTLPTADAFVAEFFSHEFGRTIHLYGDQLFAWQRNRYAPIEHALVRKKMQRWLHDCLRVVRRDDRIELAEFNSNPRTVGDAVQSLMDLAAIPSNKSPSFWIGEPPDDSLDPCNLLCFPGGTLDLESERVIAPTPRLFNVNAIDFDYQHDPAPPTRWLQFLDDLFGHDAESVQLLQEWFGYCLVADTSQQKMLLIVGPKRSGKGIIGRILQRLVGVGNVVGPTTSSLAGAFGLQPLIGKSLAIVSDARFTGDNIGVVVERLLCISGEDTLTVDRKFLGSATMKLPTRFMFLTNELPRLHDASGALAGRFVILRLTNTFFGDEDVTLTQQLIQELPGILVWAIEGLRRLRQRGHFVQPKGGADAAQEMEDLASPVLAFVRDCCVVGKGQRIWIDQLYAAWKRWCESEGRTVVASRQTFGRDLTAAVPGVSCRRNHIHGRFYDGIALRDADLMP